MIKFNIEVFKNEYRKNYKKNKKIYNRKFYIILFCINIILCTLGNFIKYSLKYYVLFAILNYSFILFWKNKYPVD